MLERTRERSLSTAELSVLFDRLSGEFAEAWRMYCAGQVKNQVAEGNRTRAIVSLLAISTFLRGAGFDRQDREVFEDLAMGLESLSAGKVDPLFSKATVHHRAPDSLNVWYTRYMIARSVNAVLLWGETDVMQASRFVEGTLKNLERLISRPTIINSKENRAETIKNWLDRLRKQEAGEIPNHWFASAALHDGENLTKFTNDQCRDWIRFYLVEIQNRINRMSPAAK